MLIIVLKIINVILGLKVFLNVKNVRVAIKDP